MVGAEGGTAATRASTLSLARGAWRRTRQRRDGQRARLRPRRVGGRLAGRASGTTDRKVSQAGDRPRLPDLTASDSSPATASDGSSAASRSATRSSTPPPKAISGHERCSASSCAPSSASPRRAGRGGDGARRASGGFRPAACAASVRKRRACVASTLTSRNNASEPQFATRAKWNSVWAGSRSSGLLGRAACAVCSAAHATSSRSSHARRTPAPRAGRERLHDQAQLVDLGQFLLGYRCDPRSALRVEDDEPFARECPQRLAQRGRAQVPRLGERLDQHALVRERARRRRSRAGADPPPRWYGCAAGYPTAISASAAPCVLLCVGRPERRPDRRDGAHHSGHDERCAIRRRGTTAGPASAASTPANAATPIAPPTRRVTL